MTDSRSTLQKQREEATRLSQSISRSLSIEASTASLTARGPTYPQRQMEITEANFASEFYKRLVEWINAFDATLDNSTEVGVRLVNFGETISFHLRDMGFYNPSLIKFVGEMDSGSQVELIQHVSQISILLMKVPRKNPEQPKQPMGFHAIREDNQKSAE